MQRLLETKRAAWCHCNCPLAKPHFLSLALGSKLLPNYNRHVGVSIQDFSVPWPQTPNTAVVSWKGGVVTVKRLSLVRAVRSWGFRGLQHFPHLSLPLGFVPHCMSTSLSHITVLQALLKLRISVASLGLSHIAQHFPGQQMEEKVVLNKWEHTRGINQYLKARRGKAGLAALFWNQNLLHSQNLCLPDYNTAIKNSKSF